ncbi:zinc finger protein DHHC domain containing protein [Tritrichomonas foetus]|uniref:Palmitoyltransferase n=1 Tax=Tritrichomonas foetus TaxID=1144522 RepID=A0A1J4JIK9_9EUKA|nr:zinc finger protein DHHC domain containing protein [Tritrichomonas foetus]|eukprot:OHS98521.1 zinc finger protein DHHC domain containing protein [Tritrichomonas foetus]
MCNKCRVGFDHHCRYINNCVTKSNYYIFFFGCLFLVSSAFIGLVQLIIYAAIYRKNKDMFISNASAYYHIQFNVIAFWVLFGVAVLFYLGLAIPMMVLIIYHVFFQVNGISTYDYIMDNISRFPQRLSKFSCVSKSRVRRE